VFKKYKIPYELDDPRATLAHRDIILNKPFLKRLYQDWYALFIQAFKRNNRGKCLEIGSGGGFLKNEFPEVITSDILPLDGVDMVFSAEEMPFKNEELSAIVMLNVFHHIPKPWQFLKEAERTLQSGGKVLMIEPANTALARFIYKRFHHEPFNESGEREIAPGNPLSNSNQALPYIYFIRDKEWFINEYKNLQINKISYHTPFLYVLSGGVSRSAMLPSFLYGFAKCLEFLFRPINKYIALFCTVELEKR